MARFVALLLIGPWLLVLAWLYWLYVRKAHADAGHARLDAMLVAAAFVAAAAGALIAWQATLDHGGPIWKFVAGPIGAYAGFCPVLFAGLAWHAWTRRRSRARPATLQRNSR